MRCPRPFVISLLWALLPTLAAAQPAAVAHTPQRLTVSSDALEQNAALAALIRDVRSQADEFVFLSGGASRMTDEHQRQLMAMFDALALLAKSGRRIAVGDGGTEAGIMQAAGAARRASGNAFPLIGMPPAGEVPPRGTTRLDPNHSHIIAVDNPAAPPEDSWGSETEAMYRVFDRLAEDRPSVTVVANGGGITLDEVAENVRAGRSMILIAGSGRAADALVSLLEGTTPASEEVATLRVRAEKGGLTKPADLYRIVPLDGGAVALQRAIEEALARVRR